MEPYTFCRKSLLIVLSFVSAAAFTSCQKDIPPIFEENAWKPGKSDKPVVFVAGYESNGINNVAKCWINNQEVTLSDGKNDAEAYSIFVTGNDTYIAGKDSGQPVYWYNNTEISLPVKFKGMYPGNFSSANSIFISGKVYIAGNDSTRAVYWKDGTEIILNISNAKGNFDYSTANSVFVSGNDIYVAGSHGPDAVYWKNGVEVYLTNFPAGGGIGSATASSIYVSEGNVYVVGFANMAGAFALIPRFWKNGIDKSASLDNPNLIYYFINTVFVSGDNVYISGFESGSSFFPFPTSAVYWKNDSVTELSRNSISSFASSIYVRGNDVYVLGNERNDNDNQDAVYWKNGIEIKLTDGANNAYATSIFVK